VDTDGPIPTQHPDPEAVHADAPRSKRPWYKRPLAVAAASVALLVAAGVGGRAYVHAQTHESTDDAFVEGRVVRMSPRVAGHVAKLLVTDNQHVEAGQVLVEIDDRDFRARLDQARAALESAKGKQAAAQAQCDRYQWRGPRAGEGRRGTGAVGR
jgi:membrane fusion protein (multidrug efflux system)